MKITISENPARAPGHRSPALLTAGVLTIVTLLLGTADLRAGGPNGVTVSTLCGGGVSPFYGYIEGDPTTSTDAKFHTPIGLAQDSSGDYLFVADRDNNRVRMVDLNPSQPLHYNSTYTFVPNVWTPANVITNPVDVVLDIDDNVYVLNRGNGTNGTVLEFDSYFHDLIGTNAVGLTNANAFTLDPKGNIYVTVSSNQVVKITPGTPGTKTTVATVTNAGACLQGIVVMNSGLLAVCDSGRNGIYLINPTNGNYSTLTGFNGAGDNNAYWESPDSPNWPVSKAHALFNQPTGLAKAGGSILIVADCGNNRVKVVDSSGTVTNLYGVNSDVWYTNSGWYTGWGRDGLVYVPDAKGDVESRLPNGMLVAQGGSVYVTEDYYHLIRKATSPGITWEPPAPHSPANLTVFTNCGQISLTWSASTYATNYNVKRSITNGGPYTIIGSTNATSYTDINVGGGTNYYYVVAAVDAAGEGLDSAQVSATLLPPDAPIITTVNTNCGQVSLIWSTVVCATNYYVKRSTNNGGPYSLIASTSATNYTDPGVLGGTTYYYVVSALGVGGEGLNSAQVSAKPMPPAAPANLTVFTNCGQISLTWSAAICATNYYVKRSTANGGPYSLIASTSATNYTDTGTLGGTTYYYVVSALNAAGEGDNSAQVSATPLPPAAPIFLNVTTNYVQVSLTWSTVTCATNYHIKRSTSFIGPYTPLGSTTATSYTDNTVLGCSTYYYVVSAFDAGGESTNSTPVVVKVPSPPIDAPQIGYVDFPATSTPISYTSVFHPEATFIFNNDTPIIIIGEAGSQTYYEYGATSTNILAIPDPTTNSPSAPSGYLNGLTPSQVIYYAVASTLPDLTIKAIGAKSDGCSPNSAIVTSRFQFITANPTIIGDNAAQFFISDITTNAHLYYTTDNSDPSSTNGVDLGTVATPTDLWTVGFPITTNTVFKVRAFHDNYQPSAIVSTSFSPTNFIANIISFGFASGEASSDFVASPGQTFYAPVTLSVLSQTLMYSLQFNLTVTNGGPNPGSGGISNYNFSSMLVKPIPGVTPIVYEPIPPAMFVFPGTINPNPVLLDGSTDFASLIITNNSLDLLGAGWVERKGATNLYITTDQDLIQYSIAHDTLFLQGGGKVVVGGYAFQVPASATNSQTYQIQIARPSATADGVGAPGSDVYIAAPTNGSLKALEYVTVGQRKYIAGSVYPFRWFNAGDFGSSNIVSADVEQVFEAAVYRVNSPASEAPGSDFFDAMDSCGGTYIDLGQGYLQFDSTISSDPSVLNPLFDGNDTTINQIAFGDGTLDVCDVYVTYRRSLDPSLYWFQRFWTNGVRVATILTNQTASIQAQAAVVAHTASVPATNLPVANFAGADSTNSAGQTVQIPITAQIVGAYPLRVLMLNLSVVPLDGSPALTSPVQFTPNAALGQPWAVVSSGPNNYAATWLNNTISGLTGTAALGTLSVPIPATATANAAYAVHFDHASASPNGLASFPKHTFTGLITLSSRTSSHYNDGIPDSWRLRWFGTVYNALSAANTDACGDGISNWQKYIAGTDPTDPTAYPRLKSKTPAPSGSTFAIHWPTVAARQYVIERSASLFPGVWTTLGTNTGTGGDMEFDDSNNGQVSFYRVLILP